MNPTNSNSKCPTCGAVTFPQIYESGSSPQDERRLPGESDGLGPVFAGNAVIGSVDHINGPDGVLMNFVPTRAELMTLARDYLNRIRELECWQATGNSGSFEIRETAFCWRRFESISEAISPGKLLSEFQEFFNKLKEEIDEIEKETKEREVEEARRQDDE